MTAAGVPFGTMVPAQVDGAKATEANWLRPSTDKAPRFQIERTSYGFRYAAIRRPIKNEDTHDYIRTTVYIAPYTALIPPNNVHNVATLLAPEDDTNTIFYFIAWNGPDKPGIDADTCRSIPARRGSPAGRVVRLDCSGRFEAAAALST